MPRVRFNHMELTVAKGVLTEDFRAEVRAFYGDVLGWMVTDVEIVGGRQLLLRPDETQFILVAESSRPLSAPGYDHLGLLCDSRDDVDDVLARCEKVMAGDDRMQIKYYDDLRTGGVVVHAFYVKYLLPIWFDVQVIERVAPAPA
jgi:hypothetical protein